MPVRIVRKNYTAEVIAAGNASRRRILEATVEDTREDIRGDPNFRFDTGAQNKGVYIKGPGFNDYDERQTEAAVLYEGKESDPGRVMKLADELEIDDEEHTAVVGASTGHTLEYELGLNRPAEPVFLPNAEKQMPKFIKRIEQEYFRP
jgi:hypothetical protein